jgi:hypothetical protein
VSIAKALQVIKSLAGLSAFPIGKKSLYHKLSTSIDISHAHSKAIMLS